MSSKRPLWLFICLVFCILALLSNNLWTISRVVRFQQQYQQLKEENQRLKDWNKMLESAIEEGSTPTTKPSLPYTTKESAL